MSMDLQGLKQELQGEFSMAARIGLNALYPRDIEVYMLSLELTDANDASIDFLTFPVNPDSIMKSEPQVKTIEKSYNAVIVNKLGKFVPQDITIKGNFGRQFRFIIRSTEYNIAGIGLKSQNGEMSPAYKSGYGCFKVLQRICEESNKFDENGRSNRLYLHNFALGESYLVEVLNFQGNQGVGKNMIWEYDLRMKILSPVVLSQATSRKMLKANLVNTVATSRANAIAKSGKSLLGKL